MIGPIGTQIKDNLPLNIDHVSPIIDKAALYEKLLEGRIYLFPSVREGIAFSVVEAMMLGLPVVASKICSNRFLLRQNKQCLIGSNNIEGYQKILDLLLGDENLSTEIAKSNQRFIKFTLSKEKYFRSLYQFYSSMNQPKIKHVRQ